LRLATFKARRPEDLFRHARSLPWEVWLAPGCPLEIPLSARDSWLSHQDVVAATLQDAVSKRFETLALPAANEPGPPQQLLVRIEHDQVTLSLDSSGELLHRRGYREQTGKAPLRETLAAGILLSAGYDGSEPLIDPMTGSGSFAIEAASIALDLAPGRARSFQFEHWPCFKGATWAYLRREATERARVTLAQPIVASDRSQGAMKAARANAERAGVSELVSIEAADFFTERPAVDGPGLVVLNPPYGRRIEAGNEPDALFRGIGDRLRTAYPGWRAAILVPEARLIGVLGLPQPQTLLLPHGGLKVTLVVARVPADRP